MSLAEERKGRGVVATLSVISALVGVRDNLRSVVWQPYALSLGLDMQGIGGLESSMDFSRLLVEPAFGSISDLFGRKRLLALREILALGAGLLFLFARSWHLLFMGILFTGLSMSLLSVWNAVIAESSEPSRLGFVYSIVGTCYTGAGFVGTLGAGYIADTFGFSWVYIAATGLAAISLMLVAGRLPETRDGVSAKLTLTRTVGALTGVLHPPRYIWGFYLVMSLDLFAFGMGVRLLNGMLTKSYGYATYQLGLLAAAMMGGMAIAQAPLGRFVDKIGYAKYLASSQFTASITLIMLLFSKSFAMVFVALFILGLANALWMPAEQAWIAKNVDPSERAQAIARFSTFRGLMSFPAPFVGGILFDLYGFDVPIAMNLIIAFVDGIIILLVVKDNALQERRRLM